MARSIVSLGMLPALASRIALRKRALASGSPPPVRADTVISLMNLVKSLPRLASVAPFLCLIECHFECPDIEPNDPQNRIGVSAKYITGESEPPAVAGGPVLTCDRNQRKMGPPASTTPSGLPAWGPRPAGGSDFISTCHIPGEPRPAAGW